MTTLDSLAFRSAAAIDTAVSTMPVPPLGGVTVVDRLAALRRTAGYALAGAAGVVLAVVALVVFVQPTEDVTDITQTTTPPTTIAQNTVPTTIPETAPPVVPVVPGPDAAPSGSDESGAPMLRIISPESGSETAAGSVEVVGIAGPGAAVWAPDGSPVNVADDGVWAHTVAVAVGENRLGFTATNDSDYVAAAYVTVFRAAPTTTTTKPKPKPTTTTTTKAVGWEFTAHSTYGSCEEDPPYDVYYGTGKPGTLIEVFSDYGSGSTEVGENGEWSVKVFFESAPLNTVFQVKVKDFTGAKKYFEFVHIG